MISESSYVSQRVVRSFYLSNVSNVCFQSLFLLPGSPIILPVSLGRSLLSLFLQSPKHDTLILFFILDLEVIA